MVHHAQHTAHLTYCRYGRAVVPFQIVGMKGGHGSVGPGWAPPPPPPPWPISEVAIGIRDEIRDEDRSQDEAEEDEAKDEENEEDEDEGMVTRAVLPVLNTHALANARGKTATEEARESRVPTQREEDSHGRT